MTPTEAVDVFFAYFQSLGEQQLRLLPS